jgi:hypothetical protein
MDQPLGPLGLSSSQHRRTPELVLLQKSHAFGSREMDQRGFDVVPQPQTNAWGELPAAHHLGWEMDFGLGFQVKVLGTLNVVPLSLGSGLGHA